MIYTMFDETLLNYFKDEELYKDVTIPDYFKKFISVYNNFPEKLLQG